MTLPAPLDTFFLAVSLVLGAMIGSFLNVCIYRWPREQSVLRPRRSFCPTCQHGIAAYDNIPLVSWVLLGGRCRHCKSPISWRYPLVEAITGALFAIFYLKYGFTVAAPVYMLLAAAMVVVTFVDLEHWIIPDEVTYTGIPAGLVCALVGMAYPASGLAVTNIIDALLGLVLGGGFLYLLDKIAVYLLKKPGMGFGDVKLLAMLGAFVGWKGVIFTIMMASVLGSVVGLSVVLYFKLRGTSPESTPDAPGEAGTVLPVGSKDDVRPADEVDEEEVTLEGHYLPFGPYLAVGGLCFLLFGAELVAWYLSSFDPSMVSTPVEVLMP